MHKEPTPPAELNPQVSAGLETVILRALNAEAYGWMSATYSVLGLFDFVPPAEAFPKAKAAALKALEIDDSLAEAHAAVGTVRLWSEWDWSGAENSCKRAIELNPNWAWGHATWSDWLTVIGSDGGSYRRGTSRGGTRPSLSTSQR